MKINTAVVITATILSLSISANAGEVSNHHLQQGGATSPHLKEESSIGEYVDFSLNARLRYEFREEGASDPSHAATVRVRPGITILPQSDLSFFVEGEVNRALVDDFNSGPQPSLSPNVAGNTNIFDPETTEINRAYVQYKKYGFRAKLGRQRIILDNAALVGNLMWRQNEQTYDAVTIAQNTENYGLSYSYINRVNRIFGSDATEVVEALEGDVHLFNAWAKFDSGFKVATYAYLMDFDGAAGNAFLSRASSNTYGGYINYNGFHAEYALQQDGRSSTLDRGTTDYANVYYEKKVGRFHMKGGLEYRDTNFYTPLSTVHLFNGFADRFIGQRLGLAANDPGVNNFYVHACADVADMKLMAFGHYFYDDSFSEDLGWEVDFVALKELTQNVNLVSKLAYFNGQDDDEIVQGSLQLDYSF